jgi:hypothetical protein
LVALSLRLDSHIAIAQVPVVQWPRTPPFHGGNTGSNPVGDAKSFQALSGKAPKSLGTFLGTS